MAASVTAPPRPQTRAGATTRRKFLTDIFSIIGWGTLWSIMGIFGWMFARYFFPNVLFEPPPAFEAGYPHEYPVGLVDGRWKERYNVWIVHEPYGFFALDGTCTHLGCVPSWVEVEQKFKCPCHGSAFRKDGTNFEGPAPRPFDRYKIYLGEGGKLIVDRSVKFPGVPGKNSNELYPQSILRI
jgi:cytochrome b6-f complex iron-sulfur subunit